MADANFYPSLNLTGSLGLQSLQFSNFFNVNAKQYAIGPGLTIPIFQGGQLRATLRLREAQQQEAAINFQKTVLQAWHDVDNALTAYQTEQSRRDQLVQAVTDNQHAVVLAQSRYQQGVADFLSVLDAERSLLATQLQLADSTTTVSTESGRSVQGAGRRMGDGYAGREGSGREVVRSSALIISIAQW